MLYTMIQPQRFLDSGEDFKVFSPFMGMVSILLNGMEPFEQILNILSIESPMRNQVKIVQVVSEKTFKNYTILYKYIPKEQGQITPRGQNFDCN